MATKTDEKYEETSTTTTTAAPAKADAKDTGKNGVPAAIFAGNEFAAFANAAHAATGDTFEVPKTPKEIAEEGTKLGLAGDHSTGGFNDPVANPPHRPGEARNMTRVWAMDADHTTSNRHLPDTFKPDCSVSS